MAIPSFNIAPGESSDATAARRKIAMALMMQGADTSPVRHWSQGAARALQGALGGYELYQEDQKDNKEKADARGMYSDFAKALYPQAGGAVTPAAPATPSPRGVPMAGGATEPLYSGGGANGWNVDAVNGQRIAVNQTPEGDGVSRVPSPLDPPSDKERPLLAALIQAEGTPYAANVVRNRAAETGLTIPQVIAQRGQFEPVGSGAINKYGPGTQGYNNANAAIDSAYAGNDPTRGAVNFYAPGAQAALAAKDGRPAVAKFDNGQGIDLGSTRFFSRAEPPVQSDAITAQSRAPAAPAPQQPSGMNAIAPMLPGMLNNKYMAPIAQGIISNQLQNQLKTETTDEIKEYNLYSKQEQAAGRQPKSFFDFKADLKKAGAINNNVNVGGGSDKQIFDSMDASTNAARTAAAGLAGIREARAAVQSGGFFGAGANEMLGLQKVGAALGVANSDKIVNTETFRAAIAPQVAAVLKATVGTANISNTDREFAEKAAGGNITLDEKSISRLLDIMERAGTGIVTQHQKRLEKVYPDAEKYARERALFGVDLTEAPAFTPPPAQSAGAPRVRKFNRATGRIE